jgi:hypothetical protein
VTDETQTETLEAQIAQGRRQIASDGYAISLGELTNLYRDGELIIRPAFQRLFRWDDDQKSKLIESILLGIPLPSIFVAQDDDGRWELVDGLQRISTILQLQGHLERDEQPWPLVLRKTKYLPALENASWDGQVPGTISLSAAQQLDIKRAKIDVKIIKRESSRQTRYDLFQRLNSYGSTLTAQEIRSALLVSVNPAFQAWIEELAGGENFTSTVALTDRELDQQYDLELVIRFLVLHPWANISQSSLRGRGELLDDEAVAIAENFEVKRPKLDAVFRTTFDVLAAGGEDVFRKWDPSRQKFVRGFLNTAFEVIAMGLGFHVAVGSRYRTDVIEAAKELWTRPDMSGGYATGLATEGRLARMLPIGRELMAAR